MERNIHKAGVVNLLTLMAVAATSLALARYSNTLSGLTAAVFFTFGLLISAVSLLQMRLEEKERLEQMEFEEITKDKQGTNLFTSADSETFPAKRSREQFERFFLPTFAALLVVGHGLSAYFLWSHFAELLLSSPRQPMVALALYGVAALMLFLLGKYAANLSLIHKDRLLRPSSSMLVLGAYLLGAMVIATGLLWGGVKRADLYLARVLVALLVLVGVETLLNILLEIYRPRVRGRVSRLVYESKLVGVLAQPESLFTTAAQALDYQFGFKVSETWFYKFVQRAFVWLVLAQVAALALSSCFTFVSPGKQGLIERFGRPLGANNILEPGLHFKMPWPVDKVLQFSTDEIQRFYLGFTPRHEEGHAELQLEESTVLWTVAHGQEEFNFLVASRDNSPGGTNASNAERGVPVDLLTVSVPVQFQIKDVKAWAYNHTDAAKVLERMANRELVRFLANVDLFQLMSSGREQAATDLMGLIQKRADEMGLGVKILLVGLEDIHPPTKVAASFQSVIATQQENEAKLRQAEGYAIRVRTIAEAEARMAVLAAETYRAERVTSAVAEAAQFKNKILAYNESPEVFLQRAYLQAWSAGSTNARKYVLLATNANEVIQLNLEDKIRREITDLTIPGKK